MGHEPSLILGRPRGHSVYRYRAAAGTWTTLPRYRGTHDRITALPHLYGITAALEPSEALAFSKLLGLARLGLALAGLAWPVGVRLLSTAVHLPRYRAVRIRITAQPSRAVYRATAGLR